MMIIFFEVRQQFWQKLCDLLTLWQHFIQDSIVLDWQLGTGTQSDDTQILLDQLVGRNVLT
jgi:hypothetical protein